MPSGPQLLERKTRQSPLAGSKLLTMPRALIVKLGAIGDVVMTIPGARALYDAGYEIDWVCGEVIAPVLRLYPWIQVIAVNERRLLRQGKFASMRTIAGVWRQLAGKRYDVCATLYYDRRYRLLTMPIRARRKVFLSFNDRATRLLEGRHHTDEYLRILTGRPDGEAPQQVSPVRAESLPPCALPTQEGQPRVVLVPGGAKNLLRDDALRRWPLENYVQLTRMLLAGGCDVVLAGGPDDAWTSQSFAALNVTDVIGKLSLVETLALLDSAAVTVTHDTGPLHLAGITRTAIVAVFGPTDPHGRLPQKENVVALWGGEGFACRPCYDGRDYAMCAHNGCMEQVTPAAVFAEVQHVLAAALGGRQELPQVVLPQHTPLIQLGVQ